MQDDLDDALKIDVLASALRMDKAELGALLESLAKRLQGILPESTSVELGGWILSNDRPVAALLVRFEDSHLQLVREKNGAVTARAIKVVRGVALKTSTVPLDEWVNLLAAELGKAAQQNARTRDALKQFVIG